MDYFTAEFLRTDVTEENPMVWLIEVDGVAVASRSLPLDYQVVAFQRGYIPYIPALGPEGTAAVMDSGARHASALIRLAEAPLLPPT